MGKISGSINAILWASKVMRFRWICVSVLLAVFMGWKLYSDGMFDDVPKGIEIKRAIDFKGIVERMQEKKRLEERERSKTKD